MYQRGFTLSELLTAIAIVSIFLTIGLPSFQALATSDRLTLSANSMVSALQLARTEAIKQHKPVVIVPSNSDWKNGWNVFVNADKDNAVVQDADEITFATFDSLNSNVLVIPTNSYKNHIYYDESGRVNTNGSIYFCSPVNNKDFRAVIIAKTGRIRVETTANSTKKYSDVCNG